MPATARVTVTLPTDIVRDIDRVERNRSRFILDAVRHELDRRRRDALRQSLANPHSESAELAELGLDDWADRLPNEDVADLTNAGGTAVRWVEGQGWGEVEG